ncbi:MAG: cobyrinic acid a,c-diamide synthase [Methanosaeta sp. PtaB.Bin039]|nr:MAG: cobyrinic acid a,c-diamide synthase [Methanosaeta sp. PtaB.Bin039]HOT07615.1 Ni-sirohydrochlorin a,c-diamide synthase [Methanotrichaceae archaeon]HQF15663.1 Ni-sirohydrochlorin a,c-diamide synthase [Methanotrichaceae archaeon]HQI90399.1 Ni-sirohydrochlorin a,c-diamide synthase [Methanotrichaceae archaeon]HQJ28995.1 Ni-sirohydrochlorin a,c-diamide synthase [Methanotrichaceae archaeon]
MTGRVLLAGDRSSSGKTTIVAGLLSALCSRGLSVQPFKVAMDYIDPSYHTMITGRFCRNLDGYVMPEQSIREVFDYGSAGADISIVEGVRGLYEGFDGDIGSTAQIAKLLSCPVIFVVDVRSITRSAAALVKGYRDFDPLVQMKGVILNKVGGERHAEKARREIERYAKVPVLGVIPRDADMQLSMRHLGLVPAMEGERRHSGFSDRLDAVRRIVEQGLDIGRILEIARQAEPLPPVEPDIYRKSESGAGLRIGVALDEAFNFYYRENLELFELAGAEVVPFSPVHDSRLPDVDGIYIGGGYPELYAPELSENESMRRSILDGHDRSMPIYAECGGLMYMARHVEWSEDEQVSDRRRLGRSEEGCKAPAPGQAYPMVGLVPGIARRGSRRIVSYVSGGFEADCPIGRKGEIFRGHEFHHSEMVMDPGARVEYAMLLDRGYGICNGRDGILNGSLIANYVHLHSASYRGFPARFMESCLDAKI